MTNINVEKLKNEQALKLLSLLLSDFGFCETLVLVNPSKAKAVVQKSNGDEQKQPLDINGMWVLARLPNADELNSYVVGGEKIIIDERMTGLYDVRSSGQASGQGEI